MYDFFLGGELDSLHTQRWPRIIPETPSKLYLAICEVLKLTHVLLNKPGNPNNHLQCMYEANSPAEAHLGCPCRFSHQSWR